MLSIFNSAPDISRLQMERVADGRRILRSTLRHLYPVINSIWFVYQLNLF